VRAIETVEVMAFQAVVLAEAVMPATMPFSANSSNKLANFISRESVERVS